MVIIETGNRFLVIIVVCYLSVIQPETTYCIFAFMQVKTSFSDIHVAHISRQLECVPGHMYSNGSA